MIHTDKITMYIQHNMTNRMSMPMTTTLQEAKHFHIHKAHN